MKVEVFFIQSVLQASETMLYFGNLYWLLIMILEEVLGGGPHHHLKADKVLQGAYPGRP